MYVIIRLTPAMATNLPLNANTKLTSYWRQNAAAVIVDARGYVLLGKDSGNKSFWHFPQGGVLARESLQEAVMREIQEEVGIPPEQYEIIRAMQGLRYLYPPSHRRISKWIGQEQTYFLIQCHRKQVRVNVTLSPEFSSAKWFNPKDITPLLFSKSKREVSILVLTTLLSERYSDLKIHPEESRIKSRRQSTQTKSRTKEAKIPPSKTTPPSKKSIPKISDMNNYKVIPGKKFKFSNFSPDNRDLFKGNKDEALAEFDCLSKELQELQRKLYAQDKHKILIVLQAMDAGGKDGCVRNVFSRVDPQGVRVVSFKKPSEEDLAHDFLRRIHLHTPATGKIAIFNRSHYEDILAVRVKKLFPDEVWQRRYKHVINFEELLAEEGTTIIKLFLHISKDEQKCRLESRLADPERNWKFAMDDLEDRERWDDFQDAYEDLIGKTSFEHAPWYIIPSNRKWYRNLVVARLLVKKLRALDLAYPKVTFDPKSITITD